MATTDEAIKAGGKGGNMIQWAPIAVNAVGSALSALGGNAAAKRQEKEQRRARESQERLSYAGMGQNDRQFGFNANAQRAAMLDNRGLQANALQGQLNRAPLADQAQYLIQQRLGMGNMVGGAGAAAAAYRPGMGGVDTSVTRETMARLRDQSQVPAAYRERSGGEERLTAMRDQLVAQMNAEKRPAERDKYLRRIAELDQMIGSQQAGGSGAEGISRTGGLSPEMIQAMQLIQKRLGGMG